MKELNRTRKLTVLAIIFVLVIVTGLLTFREPELKYELTSDEMLEELNNMEKMMPPDKAREIIASEDPSYLFVDLRNSYEFDQGALANAINIPVSDILLQESIQFYRQMEKDSVTIVFYGNTQREANGSWMLLQQLGFNNIKVLLNSYPAMIDGTADINDMSEGPVYSVEKPALDFAGFMEEISNQTGMEVNSMNETKTIIPIKRKKKIITEGGC